MPVNISTNERRNAHAAGYSIYAFEKQIGASLQPALVPDESGIIGAEQSLRSVASLTTAASTVYAQFLGRATGEKALNYVTFITSGTPSSTVVTKVGFAISSGPPAFAAASLTIQTSSTLDTSGTVGNKTNATAINYQPLAGEYVWVYSHHSTGTTQPTLWGVGGELGAGILQIKSSQVAAPVVGTAYTFALPAAALTVQSPLFFIR